MAKKLLRSYHPFEYTKSLIKEGLSEDRQNGYIVLTGILQKADTLNQNGRIYPREILEREVRNYQKFILDCRSTGECDHPDSSVVSLQNVSHLVLEAKFENNVVYGKIKLLNTPSGKILQTLVEDGVKLGISSRGVGSTERRGDYHVVQDDFQLICWDVVSEPSTPGAFMLPEARAFLPEGLEIDNDQEIVEKFVRTPKADALDDILNDILSMKGNK